MSDKYTDLLRRAERDELTEDEIAIVAKELEENKLGEHSSTLLIILGKSWDSSHQGLVEQFLTIKEDPILAEEALSVLCNDWGLTSQYVEQVLQFMQGVSWDTFEDCRLRATSIAGEYLRHSTEPRILRGLLEIFEDEKEEHLLRESAYSALARAMGKEYTEIPSAARTFDLKKDTDQDVLRKAQERLSREEKT